MRVSFETYTYVYKVQEKEHEQKKKKKQDIKRVEGEVIDTLMIPYPDFMGSVNPVPCFIVALDDLTFTHVPIIECKKVENIYLDD